MDEREASSLRVLVVDDDPDMRLLIETALCASLNPVVVRGVGSAIEAMEVVDAFDPDAVVTDVMMPVMDGFQLCQALRANPLTAAIPIVILTALEGPELTRRGLGAGADLCLSKPFRGEVLARRLLALVQDSTPASHPAR